MEELMFNLGKLFIGFAGMLGPVVFLMAASGARDRRRSDISATVHDALKSPELRGLYGVKITSRPFGGHTVIVYLWLCSKEQIWEIMGRLSAQLPPWVRLEIDLGSPGRAVAGNIQRLRQGIITVPLSGPLGSRGAAA